MVNATRSIEYFGPQKTDNGFHALSHEMIVGISGNTLQWLSNVLVLLPSRVWDIHRKSLL